MIDFLKSFLLKVPNLSDYNHTQELVLLYSLFNIKKFFKIFFRDKISSTGPY